MEKILNGLFRFFAAFMLFSLIGCVSAPPTLYGWGSYHVQVYEYLKGENNGSEAQLAALDEDLQKFDASGQKHPPGLHAHMGLLYASLGNNAEAIHEFETEKALFPESAKYIDFLLSDKRKMKE